MPSQDSKQPENNRKYVKRETYSDRQTISLELLQKSEAAKRNRKSTKKQYYTNFMSTMWTII